MKRRRKEHCHHKNSRKQVQKPIRPLPDTMRRSVRIYPEFAPNERESILSTMALYEEAFDDLSSYCVFHRTASRKKLQADVYPYFRAVHPEFPSALLQSVRDQATEGIKSFNENNPERKYRVSPKLKGRSTMRYTLRAVSLRGSLLTLSTVGKRIRKLIGVSGFFLERYPKEDGWKFNSALVGIDYKDRIYITLVYTKPALEKMELPKDLEELAAVTEGYDRGAKNPIADSEGNKQDSKESSVAKRRYDYNRKTCQEKDTRSSRRRLKALSGREARFVHNDNHCMSNRIANNPKKVHVLENLSGMNELKRKGVSGKKTRTMLSNWSPSQLEYDIRYKDQALGKYTEFVDPAYTSQKCSNCGNIDKNARRKGEYHCRKCGMRMQSDVNAAKNIKNRWLENYTRLPAVDDGLKAGQVAVNPPGSQA